MYIKWYPDRNVLGEVWEFVGAWDWDALLVFVLIFHLEIDGFQKMISFSRRPFSGSHGNFQGRKCFVFTYFLLMIGNSRVMSPSKSNFHGSHPWIQTKRSFNESLFPFRSHASQVAQGPFVRRIDSYETESLSKTYLSATAFNEHQMFSRISNLLFTYPN